VVQVCCSIRPTEIFFRLKIMLQISPLSGNWNWGWNCLCCGLLSGDGCDADTLLTRRVLVLCNELNASTSTLRDGSSMLKNVPK